MNLVRRKSSPLNFIQKFTPKEKRRISDKHSRVKQHASAKLVVYFFSFFVELYQ